MVKWEFSPVELQALWTTIKSGRFDWSHLPIATDLLRHCADYLTACADANVPAQIGSAHVASDAAAIEMLLWGELARTAVPVGVAIAILTKVVSREILKLVDK